MDLQLAGKRVLITGASKGIGRALADAFAAEGCALRLVARSAQALDAAAQALRSAHGVQVQCHALDLAQPSAAASLQALCDGVDILVNNAGAIPTGTLAQVDEERWRAAWDLKVFGYINLTRTCYAAMKARGGGVVLNIIGIAAERLDSAYIAGSTGNAGLVAFTRALGATSDKDGVRVLGVSPGPVLSDRLLARVRARAQAQLGDAERYPELFAAMPFGRPAHAKEVADTVVFLASPRSSYTTGVVLTVDGGLCARGGN